MNARRCRCLALAAERDHARLVFARGGLAEGRAWLRLARDEDAPAHVRAEAAHRARCAVSAAELAGAAADPNAPAALHLEAAEAVELVIAVARIERRIRGSISPRPIESGRARSLYLRQRLRVVAIAGVVHRDIKPENDVEIST